MDHVTYRAKIKRLFVLLFFFFFFFYRYRYCIWRWRWTKRGKEEKKIKKEKKNSENSRSDQRGPPAPGTPRLGSRRGGTIRWRGGGGSGERGGAPRATRGEWRAVGWGAGCAPYGEEEHIPCFCRSAVWEPHVTIRISSVLDRIWNLFFLGGGEGTNSIPLQGE